MTKFDHLPAAAPEAERPRPKHPWTPAEAEQVRAHIDRRQARPRAPRVKLKQEPGGPARIEPTHPDPVVGTVALHEAFGTAETAFADRLLRQLLAAVQRDGAAPPDEGTANALLAALHGIAPRDETEALLAAQMVATHHAAMDLLGRAVRAEYRQTLHDSGHLAIKLLRTFAAQVEALHRYRGRGQQKVTVEHVHVHAGGQAIVGTVEAGGQGRGEE